MQNNDWQNFIYFALILVLLISSVASRRDLDFRKVLKYLAAWAGIGFVVVALYAYRFEFSDVKNRILGHFCSVEARVETRTRVFTHLNSSNLF